jgi:hypothetical protein
MDSKLSFSFPFTAVTDKMFVFEDEALQLHNSEQHENFEETYNQEVINDNPQPKLEILPVNTKPQPQHQLKPLQRESNLKFSVPILILLTLILYPNTQFSLQSLLITITISTILSFVITTTFSKTLHNSKYILMVSAAVYICMRYLPLFHVLYWLQVRVGWPFVFLLMVITIFTIIIAVFVVLVKISSKFAQNIYEGLALFFNPNGDEEICSRSCVELKYDDNCMLAEGDKSSVYR